MLTLAVDIVNDSLLVAYAARECAISLAPSAEHGEVNLLFRPLAAALLGNCGDEVPLTRHFFIRWHKDQAARVFDPLAMS